MYARTVQRPKQRKAELKSFKAPISGWISNRNLAAPAETPQAQGAAILDNFFPTATSAILRRGKLLYATLGDGSQPATSLFSYVLGQNKKLFGATPTTIYNITTVLYPDNVELSDGNGNVLTDGLGNIIGWESTDGLEVWEGALGGDWVVAQFTTTGGTYLIGVNGASEGFVYDGANFWPYIAGGITQLGFDTVITPFTVGAVVTGGTSGATGTIANIIGGFVYLRNVTGTFQDNETLTGGGGSALVNGAPFPNYIPGITFTGAPGLTTANMSYVFVYKNSLWFIQKDTLTAWYLDVDVIGGAAKSFNPGAELTRGGTIMFGEKWSLDSGQSGGLSEQIIFVSSEGEIVVFQGLGPEDTATPWRKVGLYRVGMPLGPKAWIRAGSDIIIATSIGFISVSQAIQRDYAALAPAAVSFPIEDAWNEATQRRGLVGWNCEIWPEDQMVLVSPPVASGTNDPVVFVSNARTGAWGRFTNWHALCMEVFQGRLFFGSTAGQVFLGNVTGYDDGEPYTGVYLPLFEDLGTPGSRKIAGNARATTRAKARTRDKLEAKFDFDLALSAAPSATPVLTGGTWGTAVWGTSTWGEETQTFIDQQWRSIGGMGYACSLAYQVTSGATNPLDVEIIRLDYTFNVADFIS